MKSDIKYIKCEVCQLVAKHAYRQVKAAEKELKPGKKVTSYLALLVVLRTHTDWKFDSKTGSMAPRSDSAVIPADCGPLRPSIVVIIVRCGAVERI